MNRSVARRVFPSRAATFSRRRPERVLQIGTGNFLRAFAGWMVERMNRRGLFDGSIVVAQATPASRTTAQINAQEGCYTVLQRGLHDGQLVEEVDLVTAVSRGINPYADWQALLDCAAGPDLRFIISNTTEAGIVYRPENHPEGTCPASFPAQMTALLHERFNRFSGALDRGLILLPCELTERNGDALREIVLRHALEWGLREDFATWVRGACAFANTLVDRIVPGYPAEEIDGLIQRLGYEDRLLVAAELYHSWIIEADERVARELPLVEAGLNVTWTRDVGPYRTRKVRILNGAHTLMAPAAFLAGRNTVREALEDPFVEPYVRRAIFEEIVPTLELPEAEIRAFAAETIERFRNPVVRHRLLSILLHLASKWRLRVLPSLEAYEKAEGRVPRLLAFSLAALLALYRVRLREGGSIGRREAGEYELQDTPEVLRAFADAWAGYDRNGSADELCRGVLAQNGIWDTNLNAVPGLLAVVSDDLKAILGIGAQAALQRALGE